MHVFYDWTDSLPRQLAGLPGRRDPDGLLARHLLRRHHSGASDDADRARPPAGSPSTDRPVLLRWGWEMNGDWYAWSGRPATATTRPATSQCWQTAARHLRRRGRRQRLLGVEPQLELRAGRRLEHLRGATTRATSTSTGSASPATTCTARRPTPCSTPIYRTYAARKPIMITEVGLGGPRRPHQGRLDHRCSPTGSRPTRRSARVVWFDTDTHPGLHGEVAHRHRRRVAGGVPGDGGERPRSAARAAHATRFLRGLDRVAEQHRHGRRADAADPRRDRTRHRARPPRPRPAAAGGPRSARPRR